MDINTSLKKQTQGRRWKSYYWTAVRDAQLHAFTQKQLTAHLRVWVLWPITYTAIKPLKSVPMIHKVRGFRFWVWFKLALGALIFLCCQCIYGTMGQQCSSTAAFSTLVLLSSGARQFFVVEGCPVHHGMFRITSCQKHSPPPHYSGQKCLPISPGGQNSSWGTVTALDVDKLEKKFALWKSGWQINTKCWGGASPSPAQLQEACSGAPFTPPRTT